MSFASADFVLVDITDAERNRTKKQSSISLSTGATKTLLTHQRQKIALYHYEASEFVAGRTECPEAPYSSCVKLNSTTPVGAMIECECSFDPISGNTSYRKTTLGKTLEEWTTIGSETVSGEVT